MSYFNPCSFRRAPPPLPFFSLSLHLFFFSTPLKMGEEEGRAPHPTPPLRDTNSRKTFFLGEMSPTNPPPPQTLPYPPPPLPPVVHEVPLTPFLKVSPSLHPSQLQRW
eukprot:Sspe_Gene.28049::Locus_12483_Transcript_1_1_Confidence_1.000_Length_531::g.28049::m.28049